MSQVIDLSNKNDWAKESADSIISVINAKAASDLAQTKLKQSLLLDQIGRQRNRLDKQDEFKDQLSNAMDVQKMQQPTPDVSPMATPGLANSQTANQTGSNPAAPTPDVSPLAQAPQQMPGLPAPGSSPLAGAMPLTMGAQPQQDVSPLAGGQQAQPQAQEQQAPAQPQIPQQALSSPIGAPLPPPRGQIVMDSGKPTYKPYNSKEMIYQGLYKKWASGQPLSAQEGDLVKQLIGVKDSPENGSFPGIDTVNQSPDQIQAQLQQTNPGQYKYLEAIKDGKINISGRTSKDLRNEMKQVETLWPGTDLTQVQSRIKVRNDFTAGPAAKNLDALNTAIHHADTAYGQVAALGNGDFKAVNGLGNWMKSNAGDPRVDVLKSTLGVLNREVNKAIAAGVVTNEDKSSFESSLNAAQSATVAKQVIDNYISLIAGRTQPLKERLDANLPNSGIPIIRPSAMQILQKHGFSYDPQTGDIAQGSTTSGSQYAGPVAVNKAGQKLRVSEDGKSWIPM